MKNQFLAFLMLTVMFWGCKPRTQELTPQKTNINPDVIEQAKFYFENEQSISLSKPINATITESSNRVNLWAYPAFRTFQPVWSKTEQVIQANGNKVLITPLRRNMNVDYNNLYYIRRLRIELNTQNQVVKTNIVELVTLAGSVAQNKNMIIANVFEEIQTRTDAKIMVFDAGYTPLTQNISWKKGEGNNNNNANNRNTEDDNAIPSGCYQLVAVASCNDVQYIQEPSSCDPDIDGTFQGFGNPVNTCPAGSGAGGVNSNPDQPVGGGGNDTGQDDPYIFGTYDYNGLKLDSYYFNYGTIKAIDEKTVETVKEVIDDPDFRDLISAYLGTGEQNKIHIIWKEEGFFSNLAPSQNNGYFDLNTNKIYLNPSLIKRHGRIGIVKTLTHEGIHGAYFKPDAQELQEYINMKNWLNTDDFGHITHNCMSFYKVEIALRIMKRFDRGPYGSWDSRIKDEHFKGFFLLSTLGDLDANTNKPILANKAWDILSKNEQNNYRRKAKELIKIYQQLP
ncbi:MAG: hypothetical protein MUC49_13650 [Raineya sp.]|jgi:hypothetical protein|nr:hypothetical protein [Raineya sp.]